MSKAISELMLVFDILISFRIAFVDVATKVTSPSPHPSPVYGVAQM